MSDRDIDISLNPQSTAKTITQVPTPEEMKEFEARIARVYERGLVVDRLHVDLPPEYHGEWVSNDTAEIARLELIGFQIDDQFAPKRKLHDKGDNRSVVSDVVHMIQPIWMHDILEKKRAQMYFDTHLRKRQKEEKDFLANQATIGETENSKVASVAENLPGYEITQRLSSKE